MRRGRRRAGHRQDAAARRVAAPGRGARAGSSSPGRRRSSSATCRSASGSTRSTRTSLRRSSSLHAGVGRRGGRRARARSFRRCAPPTATRRRSVADERYRAHRAVRRLLELLAADRPLVLVLDDLHWSDGASIELLGALLRRGTEAPVLLALGFRSGQAPARLSAALAAPSVRRIALEPAQRGGGDAAAARARRAGGEPRSTGTAAATRSTSSSSRGPAAACSPTRRSERRRRRGRCPAAVAASLAEELASLAGTSARCSRPRPSRASRSSPISPRRSPSCRRQTALDALDALLELDLLRPTPVPRRFVFRHPLVRRAVYESAAGGWRLAAHARAATELAARGARRVGARAPRRAVGGAGRRGGDRAAARSGSRDRAARAAVAARWFEAALRLLRASDDERQVDVRVALASALRSLGELERCRATLLEAIELLPPDAARAARRAHGAVRRGRALARAPRGGAPAAGARVGRACPIARRRPRLRCRSSWRSTACTSSTSSRRPRWAAERSRRPARSAIARSSPRPRPRSASARPPRGGSSARASTARRRSAEVDRLSDAELAPRLEALYYLGWAETYLEHYADALAHFERGIDDRARDRRRTAARSDDARQELHASR